MPKQMAVFIIMYRVILRRSDPTLTEASSEKNESSNAAIIDKSHGANRSEMKRIIKIGRMYFDDSTVEPCSRILATQE